MSRHELKARISNSSKIFLRADLDKRASCSGNNKSLLAGSDKVRIE